MSWHPRAKCFDLVLHSTRPLTFHGTMATARPARALSNFICKSCRSRLRIDPTGYRTISSTPSRKAQDERSRPSVESILGSFNQSRGRELDTRNPQSSRNSENDRGSAILDALDGNGLSSLFTEEASRNLDAAARPRAAHRLHVYATKHNTHITLVQPPRRFSETASLQPINEKNSSKTSSAEQNRMVDTMISLSTGNIGFKKAGRGSYDAAFQLAAFVLRQMQDKGITREIRDLEVVLRGFGAGREAVTKALLGTEGRHVRMKISTVMDATRLKQGGPRGKKPRRLG